MIGYPGHGHMRSQSISLSLSLSLSRHRALRCIRMVLTTASAALISNEVMQALAHGVTRPPLTAHPAPLSPMIRRTPQHHSVAFSSPLDQTQRIYNRSALTFLVLFCGSVSVSVSLSVPGTIRCLQNCFSFALITYTIGWSNRLNACHRQSILVKPLVTPPLSLKTVLLHR